MLFLAVVSVSEVSVSTSLETAPISPATISSVSIWFFPLRKNREPNFSLMPFDELYRVSSFLSFPLTTLNIEILPTNGSTIVLNTTAENGSFGSTLACSPSSLLKPLWALSSFGLGIYEHIVSSNISRPAPVSLDPAISGTAVPSSRADVTPS